MLYSNNYEASFTTFEPILNIPFNKSVGQFFVDTQEFKSNARIIKMDNSIQGNEEEQKYSYKIKMPSEDFGKYKILENSNKSLADLRKSLPKTFTTPEVKIECGDEEKFKINQFNHSKKLFIILTMNSLPMVEPIIMILIQ